MRAYIAMRGNQKEIRVDRTQKEMRADRSLFGWYENPKERCGVIFGRIEVSGDRMDGWAKHVHHIAIMRSGRGYRILGWIECEYGWYGTHGESPKVWKPRMIELAKQIRAERSAK